MAVIDIVLLVVLLLCALFIVVAVLFQKSSEEGLSGTIAGGNDTYYGKEKSGGSQKMWIKWTTIIAIIFAIAVAIVFIMQPDYAGVASGTTSATDWQNMLEGNYLYLYQFSGNGLESLLDALIN